MAEPTETKVTTATTKPITFAKEDLINAASQLGTTPEIMAGALYDVAEPITKDDAIKRVADFLKKPVNNK